MVYEDVSFQFPAIILISRRLQNLRSFQDILLIHNVEFFISWGFKGFIFVIQTIQWRTSKLQNIFIKTGHHLIEKSMNEVIFISALLNHCIDRNAVHVCSAISEVKPITYSII